MALIPALIVFTAGTKIKSVEANSNFDAVKTAFNNTAVLTDVARVITVSHTFAGASFTGDVLFTDALYDIGKSGVTRPRNVYASGRLVAGGAGFPWGGTFGGNGSSEIVAFGNEGGGATIQAFTAAFAAYSLLKINPQAGVIYLGSAAGATNVLGPLNVTGVTSLGTMNAFFGVKAASSAQAVFGTTDVNSMQLIVGNTTNVSIDFSAIEQSVAYRTIRLNPIAGEVELASTGVATRVKGTLLVSGNIIGDLLFTDALYDIGKSGATRPRNIFLSGNVNAAGQVDVGTAHVRQGTTTAGVAGVATSIYSMGVGNSALVLVIGNNGVDYFQDLVAHAPAKPPQVISSFTVSGAPAVRTYSATTTPLLLAMASGTYTIKTMPFEVS